VRALLQMVGDETSSTGFTGLPRCVQLLSLNSQSECADGKALLGNDLQNFPERVLPVRSSQGTWMPFVYDKRKVQLIC
jgi:hypothetical protein